MRIPARPMVVLIALFAIAVNGRAIAGGVPAHVEFFYEEVRPAILLASRELESVRACEARFHADCQFPGAIDVAALDRMHKLFAVLPNAGLSEGGPLPPVETVDDAKRAVRELKDLFAGQLQAREANILARIIAVAIECADEDLKMQLALNQRVYAANFMWFWKQPAPEYERTMKRMSEKGLELRQTFQNPAMKEQCGALLPVASRILEAFQDKVAPYSRGGWEQTPPSKLHGDAVAFAWQLAVILEAVIDPTIHTRIDAIEVEQAMTNKPAGAASVASIRPPSRVEIVGFEHTDEGSHMFEWLLRGKDLRQFVVNDLEGELYRQDPGSLLLYAELLDTPNYVTKALRDDPATSTAILSEFSVGMPMIARVKASNGQMWRLKLDFGYHMTGLDKPGNQKLRLNFNVLSADAG